MIPGPKATPYTRATPIAEASKTGAVVSRLIISSIPDSRDLYQHSTYYWLQQMNQTDEPDFKTGIVTKDYLIPILYELYPMEINPDAAQGSQQYPLQFIVTADGSKTVFNPRIGSHYHSINGALQESRHVFLESGLKYFLKQTPQKRISILEAGFGTGLNFLLSAEYCQQNKIELQYSGIEAYPLSVDQIRQGEYNQYINEEIWNWFLSNYEKALQEEIFLSPFIQLEIIPRKLHDFDSSRQFDILYFDAFAAVNQPEMWTVQTLDHVCNYLHPGGLFVTFAMNGNLKRNMKALGFLTERVPGAAGKREMLRATRIGN